MARLKIFDPETKKWIYADSSFVDIAAIVNAVIAQLPVYNGEVV